MRGIDRRRKRHGLSVYYPVNYIIRLSALAFLLAFDLDVVLPPHYTFVRFALFTYMVVGGKLTPARAPRAL